MSVQLTKPIVEPIVQEKTRPPRPIESGEQATRRAKNYLTKYIGIHFRATDPELIQLDKPIWQVLVSYKLAGLAPFRVGFLDIDAASGEAIPISDKNKRNWIDRANVYYQSNASSAASPQRLP